ncbi:MAG: hypothetical protein QOH60_4375 [Mycobacterium sp.]|nr:hypothetical protein [Mycobacterium sp.]
MGTTTKKASLRLLVLLMSVAMITLTGGLAASTATGAPPPGKGNNTNVVKVTGTGTDGAKFNGQFTAKSSKADSSAPKGVAVDGLLTGKLINPGQGQNTSQDVSQPVSMPVADLQATCQVLNLVLGPLDLSLLGLNVHLDQVTLNVTADPSGGILGQLLCSLAGGLNGPVDAIVNLLNQILAILGGL